MKQAFLIAGVVILILLDGWYLLRLKPRGKSRVLPSYSRKSAGDRHSK